MYHVPEWAFEPGASSLPYLPLETLPAKGNWRCVITSERLYRPNTHWIAHRTLPCLGDSCGACAALKPKKREAFAGVMRSNYGKHFILRLTENVARLLLRDLEPGASLRGTCFSIRRKGEDKHGYVEATLEDAISSPGRLPAAPDLPLQLSRIWRIDGWEPAVGLEQYAEQMIRLCQDGSAPPSSEVA